MSERLSTHGLVFCIACKCTNVNQLYSKSTVCVFVVSKDFFFLSELSTNGLYMSVPPAISVQYRVISLLLVLLVHCSSVCWATAFHTN